MDQTREATVLAGLPVGIEMDITGPIYPQDTFAVLGMLRQEGLDIDFEAPRDLHPLLDLGATGGYLVPIIVFSEAGLRSRGAQLLPSIVRARANATARNGEAHCRIGRCNARDETAWFVMSAPITRADEALRQWLSENPTT